MQVFEEVLLFKLRTRTKKNKKTTTTEKQAINSTYPVSVGCGRLAEGKGHATDSERSITPKYQIVTNVTKLANN